MAAGLTAAVVGTPARAASLEVAEAAWAVGVRDLAYVARIDGAADVRRPLYFWTRLKADAAALAELQARGQLPIRHRWIRYVGPEPDFQTVRPTDEIAVGAAAAPLIERLRGEVRARGFFDWRTWSVKRNLRTGSWLVELVYQDGQPVLCASSVGATEPCRYRISVMEMAR